MTQTKNKIKCPKEAIKTSHLQCKFCGVKVLRWKMVGKRKVDGFDTIKEHIMTYHEDEAEKMGMAW